MLLPRSATPSRFGSVRSDSANAVAPNGYGLRSHGLYSYGLCSYGLNSHRRYSHSLHSLVMPWIVMAYTFQNAMLISGAENVFDAIFVSRQNLVFPPVSSSLSPRRLAVAGSRL